MPNPGTVTHLSIWNCSLNLVMGILGYLSYIIPLTWSLRGTVTHLSGNVA